MWKFPWFITNCASYTHLLHAVTSGSHFSSFAAKRSPGAIMKTCTRARGPGNSSQQPPHGAMGSPWYDWGHRCAGLSQLRCTSIRLGHFFVISSSKVTWGDHENMHTGPRAEKLVAADTPWCHGTAYLHQNEKKTQRIRVLLFKSSSARYLPLVGNETARFAASCPATH